MYRESTRFLLTGLDGDSPRHEYGGAARRTTMARRCCYGDMNGTSLLSP